MDYESPLKYAYKDYTVYASRVGRGIDPQEARKEYSRLRSIANKRLKRIANSEFKGLEVFNFSTAGEFAPLSEITPKDFPYKMQEIASFLNRRESSLKELRKKRKSDIEAFHSMGATNITKENYTDFINFMADARNSMLAKIYGSDALVMVYNAMARAGIKNPGQAIMSDFEFWMENVDKLEQRKFKNGATAEEIRKELEK